MKMTERIRSLFHRMIEFDRGDPDLIQHFTKVYSYASLIAQSEEGFGPMEATIWKGRRWSGSCCGICLLMRQKPGGSVSWWGNTIPLCRWMALTIRSSLRRIFS